MTSVKFNPKVTNVQFVGGNVKMTLVADAETISKYIRADLTELQGKVVTADLMPESIEVITKIDQDGNPLYVYTRDEGVWTQHKQEQLNMLGDEQIKTKVSMVAISDIDKFIMNSNYAEYNGRVNPKELIDCLYKGMDMEQIADEQALSVDALEDELFTIRRHFGPFVLAALEEEKK